MLLVDMNLSPRWTVFLAEHGIEAHHWSKVGDPKAPDVDIMGYAESHAEVILTHDLDFGAILAATQREKPSVIQLRTENVSPEHAGPMVVKAVVQLSAELDDGVLLTLDPDRVRVAMLPLSQRR